ncbi:hypothetical protein N9D26_00170 [bacterium]|nr:hypothetical protein [bacterium]
MEYKEREENRVEMIKLLRLRQINDRLKEAQKEIDFLELERNFLLEV